MDREARHQFTRRTFLLGAAAIGAAAATPWWSRARAAASSVSSRQLRDLARSVRGPVVMGDDPGLPVAAQLWNSRFDRVRPKAVVYAIDERDVQQTVRWAARTGTRLATRAGGHSYEGYSTTTSGVILDISDLSRIEVNARERKASIGGGAQLVNVYNTLANDGQTIPGGSCPTVGIAGLTLGGGLGFAGRRWGTTSDNLLAARIVTPDGRIRTIDRTRDEDLYWACRGGGGGNFGVVTAFLFRTYPADPATLFQIAYAWEDMPAVLDAWQRWAPFATPDVFSLCTMGTKGGEPRIEISGQYFGPADDVAALVRPVTAVAAPTAFNMETKKYIEAVKYWAQCTEFTAEQCLRAKENPDGRIGRPSFGAKSDYVRRPLPAAGIAAIKRWIEVRQAQRETVGPGNVICDAYGGAINEVSPTATAFAHRDMHYSIQYDAEWTVPEGQRPTLDWLGGVHGAMRPHVTGSAYVNYIDSRQPDWQRAYYGRNFARLVDVKGRYDPDNVFRFAQSIPLPGTRGARPG